MAPLIEHCESVCEMGTPFQPVDPTHPKVLVWTGAWQPAETLPIVTEMLQDWTNIHASPLWQSPGIGKLYSYPLWLELAWQLIPVVSVSSKCSVVIHPVRNHHFHHHLFFAQNCRTRNITEDKDGLKPYTTTDMRKTPFGIPPMELKRDIPYLLGA